MLYLAPAEAAELLGIEVDEVVQLLWDGRLRGARLGSPPRWRIERPSVQDYLDAQHEESRRMALWRQSQAASMPEVWGGAPRI